MNWHIDRLREELHKEIGLAIASRVRDPRVPPVVTVTEVRLATDCRNATIFVSVFGDDKTQKAAIAALNNAGAFLQHVVSERVRMKFFPRLYFKIDKSLEESERINELLKEVHDDLV
jgi:ribosome-binding factor A